MKHQHRIHGMFYMIFAVALLSCMDAGLKQLSAHYSALQVTSMRGMASLPFALVIVAKSGGFGQLLKVRWGWQVTRGVLSILTLLGMVHALKALNLADAYCIFFIAPLLIAAVSVPLLGERIEWQRWVAIGVGLAGVVWMLKPSGDNWISLGALAALGATLGYVACSMVLRVVSATDSSASSTFWFLTLVAIGAGVLAGPDWRMPLREDWPWLLMVGVTGIIGQLAISEAFRLAPPAVVAPFEYTALLWGVLLDFFLWGAPPNTAMWGGALLVIGSGLYALWREHLAHQQTSMATPLEMG